MPIVYSLHPMSLPGRIAWLRVSFRYFPDMHTVAAVVDQGALTFDFAIPCEVFGLDRSDIASPGTSSSSSQRATAASRTQTGFVIEAPLALDALERADTIIVPGWGSPDVAPPAS